MTPFPAMKPESIRCVPSACRSGMAGGILAGLSYLGVRASWCRHHYIRHLKGRRWYERLDVKESEIWDTLYAARKAYRAKAKQVHPDMNGGRAEWDRLNFAWQNVRRAFARRGYTV